MGLMDWQVDIELPEDLPLKEAHAIGESLQIKIEELPEVERAFVHLDFECDHKPEHSILSKLPSSQPWLPFESHPGRKMLAILLAVQDLPE